MLKTRREPVYSMPMGNNCTAALRLKPQWRLCTTDIHVSGLSSTVMNGFMLSMQALAELLKVTHRGYFIPPRPEKNPVEGQRASNDFVELRRHALEKYLIQLASHPAIVQSDVSTLAHRTGRLFALSSLLLACWHKYLYIQGLLW